MTVSEIALFGLGAVFGAIMLALVIVTRNFVAYLKDRRMPTEHIWEIAWRGKSAGDSP